MVKRITRQCVMCGADYAVKRDIQLYCSKRCKNRAAGRRYIKKHGSQGYLEAAYRERNQANA